MPTGGAAGLPREASRNLTSSDGSENQPTLSRDGSGGGSGSGSGGGSGGKGSSSGVILRSLVKALPWALLLLFGVRGLLAMRSDGTTVDEPFHLAYGERALAAGTFLRENDLLNSKMPVSVLNAIPVAAANRGSSLSWRQKLFIARLPTLLLGVLLGALVWRWAHALFGPWSGVLALVLYSFCPNMLAHSHLVTTDVATGLGMFAATYCFWRYLTVPSRGRLLVAAAVFGAAQLTKATALCRGRAAAEAILRDRLERGGRDAGAPRGAGLRGPRRLRRRRDSDLEPRLLVGRHLDASQALQLRERQLQVARGPARRQGPPAAASLRLSPGYRHGVRRRDGRDLELSPRPL